MDVLLVVAPIGADATLIEEPINEMATQFGQPLRGNGETAAIISMWWRLGGSDSIVGRYSDFFFIKIIITFFFVNNLIFKANNILFMFDMILRKHQIFCNMSKC